MSTPVPQPWLLNAILHLEEPGMLGEVRMLHAMARTAKIQDEHVLYYRLCKKS